MTKRGRLNDVPLSVVDREVVVKLRMHRVKLTVHSPSVLECCGSYVAHRPPREKHRTREAFPHEFGGGSSDSRPDTAARGDDRSPRRTAPHCDRRDPRARARSSTLAGAATTHTARSPPFIDPVRGRARSPPRPQRSRGDRYDLSH